MIIICLTFKSQTNLSTISHNQAYQTLIWVRIYIILRTNLEQNYDKTTTIKL